MGKAAPVETVKRNNGVTGAPVLKDDVSGCTEAVCGVVEACEKASGKFVKLSVNIGDEVPLTIATNWDGVGEGSRVCIAVVGSFVADVEVTPVERGGVTSQGLLCDAAMLGWAGGAAGAAVLLPTSFSPGDPAPHEKPRRAAANGEDPRDPNAGSEALFGPVLSKEDKKKAAAAKKAEREARKAGVEPAAAGAAPADGAAKVRVPPSKADLKKIKKLTAEKRKAAEKAGGGADEIFTDDELEAAGFLLEGEE